MTNPDPFEEEIEYCPTCGAVIDEDNELMEDEEHCLDCMTADADRLLDEYKDGDVP